MPFDLREVLETVQMTEADAFDIRTVTLGISLRGCASRTAASTRQNVYDRIVRRAERHVEAAREIESDPAAFTRRAIIYAIAPDGHATLLTAALIEKLLSLKSKG